MASGLVEATEAELQRRGYRDLVLLGFGGSASVYAACNALGERVALRVNGFFNQRRSHNRADFRNLCRAKLLCALLPGQPHVVAYRHACRLKVADRDNRMHYTLLIEMEFVAGRTLVEAMTDPIFRAGGLHTVERLILELCVALEILYRRRIRLNDLSLTNIMLEDLNASLKLIDISSSFRMGNVPQRDREDVYRTLRHLMTGRREIGEPNAPVDLQQVERVWGGEGWTAADAQRGRRLTDWVESLAPSAALGQARPAQVLADFRALLEGGR